MLRVFAKRPTFLPLTGEQALAKRVAGKLPRKFSVVSLFSGCGGLDLGFRGGFEFLNNTYDRLPFDIIWANDIDSFACDTYRKNIGNEIHCGDVWNLIEELPETTDVLIGGFPCQDVSVNGHGKGEDGERTNLYKAMIEVIKKTKPSIFIAENVKGLLMKRHEKFWNKILSGFSKQGYDMYYKIYLAADYGVPQMRERVFIFGIQKQSKKFILPEPILSNKKWITSKEALKDLETMKESLITNHIWSKAKRAPDQGNRIIKKDKPADTIRAECHGNIQFHYELPRRLSMRETARCQSFPDDFVFNCGIRQMERQIGNAVPPVLAWHIAKAVSRFLQ